MKSMSLQFVVGSRVGRWTRVMASGVACLCLVGGTMLAPAFAQDTPVTDQPTIPNQNPEQTTVPTQDPVAPSLPGVVPDVSAPTQGLEGLLNPQLSQPNQPNVPGFEEPVEVKKVNDAVAGWNSAESGQEFNLGQTLRRTWVMLDSEGKLRGEVLGADFDHSKTEVYFVREGRMIDKLSVNAKGEFLVYGLEEGVYSLVVANEFRYAVNCLLVLENNQLGGAPSSFAVPMSDASPRSVFEQVVNRATKVTFRNFGEFAFEETADDPARLYGLKGINEHRPESVPATTLGNNRVQLTESGQLLGRVRAVEHFNGRPVDLMVSEVLLIAKDETVASTQTNRYGVFSFDGIKPGTYTLFASGRDGLAVTSFELEAAAAPAPTVEVAPVSYRAKLPLNYLDLTLSPRRDVGWVNSYFRDHVPPPRIPPVEDVPYNPYADYGQWGWGQGYPYGMGMGTGYPGDMYGCGGCGDSAWWGASCYGYRRGWLARLKARCGWHHVGRFGCQSGCQDHCGSGCGCGCSTCH
ncbi:MAG: hypothetical protein JNL67_23285 [Planctomycetaceae bacterium]|nr:hypothetical protein [Planctomycetaceae bacterium]